MRALILASLMALLLPATALAACLEEPASAKIIGPAGDPRYRAVLSAGDQTRTFDLIYIRDGKRIVRHKRVPAGCTFKTGWWKMDSGTMFKVRWGTGSVKSWVIYQRHKGKVYRGYDRGLMCPFSISMR